jgi:hypothetical protein
MESKQTQSQIFGLEFEVLGANESNEAFMLSQLSHSDLTWLIARDDSIAIFNSQAL